MVKYFRYIGLRGNTVKLASGQNYCKIFYIICRHLPFFRSCFCFYSQRDEFVLISKWHSFATKLINFIKSYCMHMYALK